MKPSHRQREVGLSPAECIQHALTEEREMNRVKELFQDIKKNWWIGGLVDWGMGEPCRTCRACRRWEWGTGNVEGGAE